MLITDQKVVMIIPLFPLFQSLVVMARSIENITVKQNLKQIGYVQERGKDIVVKKMKRPGYLDLVGIIIFGGVAHKKNIVQITKIKTKTK